jgi:hypothetical protein
MELQININLDNAAFGDNPAEEVARILANYRNSIKQNSDNLNNKYSFIDFNGNQVGEAKIIEENLGISETEEKPKVLITLENGLIQGVNSDIDLSVIVLDFDIQEAGTIQKDADGELINANLYETEFQINSEIVDYYFNNLLP